MKNIRKMISLVLLASLAVTGCGKEADTSTKPAAETENVASSVETEEIADADNVDDNLTVAIEQPEVNERFIGSIFDTDSSLDQVQLNSAYMLNYLTVLSTEITSSNSSRVFLEETYNSLVNNTSPNVDEDTQKQLSNLLKILQQFRMLDTEKERTEYLYSQNCAKKLKHAIPNPLGLLSAVSSGNLAKVVSSVAYMAIDSYASYTSYVEEIELDHLKETWKLDDAESEYIHDNRSSAFDYMINITREYDLPDDISLTEKDVDTFVQWKNNTNSESQIQFFETSESRAKYQKFGPYWLALASSYYQHGDYDKCLQAINEYEKLGCHIFRKDYEFAKTLPIAIAAADEILSGSEYIETINHFATEIINNCDQDDWRLRFIVAQTCLSLYARTNNAEYLKNAYTIAKNNVNNLVQHQISENAEYMREPNLEEVPDGIHLKKKKEVKERNKAAEKEVYEALPPVSQALLTNCQFLFAVADELGIDSAEKNSINNILHPNGERLFLAEIIDNQFWFDHASSDSNTFAVEMTEDTITIPAKYLYETASFTVVAYKNNVPEEIGDWKIESGVRDDAKDIDTFRITYESDEAEKYEYKGVDRIVITIIPEPDSPIEEQVFEFLVKEEGKLLKHYIFEGIE